MKRRRRMRDRTVGTTTIPAVCIVGIGHTTAKTHLAPQALYPALQWHVGTGSWCKHRRKPHMTFL